MNREYYITLEKGKKYLPDVLVNVDVIDPDPDYLDFTIDSLWFGDKEITDKVSCFNDIIDDLVANCVFEDNSLQSDYNEHMRIINEDLQFREVWEG